MGFGNFKTAGFDPAAIAADLLWSIDNSKNIGAIGGSRPKDYFGAGNVSVDGYLIGSAGVLIGGSGTGIYMQRFGDGILRLANLGGNDFGRLMLGGSSAAFPSIARNGAVVDVRLADNSSMANLHAAGIWAGTSTDFSNRLVDIVAYTGTLVSLAAGVSLVWESTAYVTGSPDLGLARSSAGVLAFTDGAAGKGIPRLSAYTVAQLPSAVTVGAGALAFVTDSTVTAAAGKGNAVVGGGANKTVVGSDGANWIIQ